MAKKSPRSPRIDFRVSVQVEAQSRLQQFYSRNLSSGGIYLEVTGEPPAIGSQLQLKFDIPQAKKTLTAQAEVVHHHKFEEMDQDLEKTARTGIGLKFLKLSKNDENVISQFVTGKGLRVSS